MKALSDIVVIDTEAGGLDPLVHSLLSVGLVSGEGDRAAEFFVREPEIVVSASGMAVNRIDLAQVEAEGLSPGAACDALEAFLAPVERPMLAGHNIAFDLAYLRRLYHLAGRAMPKSMAHRTVDTHSLMWALRVRGRLPAHVTGSDAAFAYFEIAPPAEARHTALGDAQATRLLVARLLECLG